MIASISGAELARLDLGLPGITLFSKITSVVLANGRAKA
jgi:hypothetical protein